MIAHSQEWWDGYKAALELVGMMVEKNINICKDIAIRAEADGKDTKKDFAETARNAYEITRKEVDKAMSDIPEVE